MQIQPAQELALTLMERHGLGEWKLTWITSDRLFGRCWYEKRVIQLSRGCETPTAKANAIGAKARACYGLEIVRPTKWKVLCTKCGEFFHRSNRRPDSFVLAGMYHRKCGPSSMGYIRYLPNDLFVNKEQQS